MRSFPAKYSGKCAACKGPVASGDEVLYDENTKSVFHPKCVPAEQGELGDDAVRLAAKLGFRPHEEFWTERNMREVS
jgi:hypothetical protein